MTYIAHVIVNILLVAAILLGMTVILLGLRQLSHDDMPSTDESTDRLRRDVRTGKNVITRDSVFHNFIVKRSQTQNHKF